MSRAIILHAPDGATLAARTRDLLLPEPIVVELAPDPALPIDTGINTWESACILVILTPELLAHTAVAPLLDRLSQRSIPIIPVVPDLTTFHFSGLKSTLPAAYLRNAAGLEPGGGAAVIDAVRGHLGLESFARDKKVFISYRRSDGHTIAEAVYQFLWDQKFETFLDQFQLPAGALVQDDIMSALAQMDFVLLIDTPDAANSPWVHAEIVEAMRSRIPICRVCTASTMNVPIYQEAPRLDWDPADPLRLDKIKRLVSQGIAARRSHENRVVRTLAQAFTPGLITIETLARRQFLLSDPTRRVLVESEQAPPSVERIHRLELARLQFSAGEAILVAGDGDPTQLTRDAIAWACRGLPLHVIPLIRLHLLLHRIFH